MHFIFAHNAVAQFRYQRSCAQRQFIHPVAAPDHQCALRAKFLQHAGLNTDEIGMEDAHQNIRRTGRVGQGAKDVEHRAHAHLTAHRRHHFHRWVVHRREHEADAGGFDAGGHVFRPQLDLRAQRFEHIGAAGFRRHAAIAVFRDFRARRRNHEHAGGGDIEGMRAVAAGADDIDQLFAIGHFNLVRKLAQYGGRCGNLADRFFLHAQAGEDRRDHRRRYFAAHDLPHQIDHLVVKDLAMLDRPLQRCLGSNGHRF